MIWCSRESLSAAPNDLDIHLIMTGGRTARQADCLLQISSCFDQVSGVAQAQRTALEELLERIYQLESENARHVKLAKPDRRHLEAELASTTEQLRLIDDEVLNLRRNPDQSRETTREVESHSRDLGDELDKFQAKLRETEDERRASEIKYVQAVEHLRLRSAELESFQFEYCQATSLSATLQNRIYELEAQVTTLQSTQRDSPATVVYIRPPSFNPMDIGIRSPWSPSSLTLICSRIIRFRSNLTQRQFTCFRFHGYHHSAVLALPVEFIIPTFVE